MTQQKFTSDLNNTYGQDLIYSSSYDLDNVSDVTKSQQRVQRRLLTNPGDYIWHPTYGAGLPAFVGQALSTSVYTQIQSLIITQIFLEDSVSRIPVPVINLQTIQGGLLVQISYVVNPIGIPTVLTFVVEP